MMKLPNRAQRIVALLGGTAAVALWSPAVLAQETSEEQAVQEQEAEAPEGTILVTATRTSRDITDVPVAVNVMDDQMLTDLRIQSVGDVLNYTPGAVSYGTDDPSSQSVFIRGVGSDILGASADPAVVTMVDGAVISRTWMRPGAIFDLNRVEVARGPQGTTFGRNATAGVVQFVSNRPSTSRNSGEVDLGIGNLDLFEGRAAANFVLSDKVAMRLAGYFQSRDGYFTNELDEDETFGDRNTKALRGQLLFELTDNFDLLVRGAYSDEHIDEVGLGDLRGASATYPFFGTFTPLDDDPRSTQTSSGQFWDRELWDLGFEASLAAGDLTFTWTGDYADGSLVSFQHPWSIPFLAYRVRADEQAQVWQSEFRVDNSAADSALQYVAGLYYLNEDITRQEEKLIMVGTPLQAYHDFLQQNQTDSYGIFANVQYEFSTGTTVSLGGRYSYDNKDYQVPFMSCSKDPNPGGLNPVPGGRGSPICNAFLLEWSTGVNIVSGGNSENWDNFSYRASITQAITPDVNVYASYATAYKGGGFPNEPNSGRPEAFLPYDPETVATFELGLKGAIFDRRLHFEIAAFDSTYDDRQQETILQPPGTNVVFNIESASIQGIETQVSLDIIDGLNVTGNLTLLDHKDDTTDLPLAGLADTTAFLATSYTLPLPGGSNVRFTGDLQYRSSRLNAETPPLTIPGETLLGANVGWTSADDSISVNVWARNLTNELDVQGLSTRTVLSPTGGTLIPGAPRTYGITAGYRF